MQLKDRESWFWTLSQLGDSSPREQELLEDSVLEAYRSGTLTEEERDDVELKLVSHPQNRRRLVELAGLAPQAPSAILRHRVLESRVLENRALEQRALPRRVRPFERRWLALAAAAVLVMTFSWFFRSPTNTPPAYEVKISGLAERRGSGVESDTAVARVDTQVKIEATVAGQAFDDVEVGLYRAADRRLLRLPAAVGSVRRSGAAVFEAPASALVGEEPGLYELFVVIAWQGQLPASLAFEEGDDLVVLLEDRGRRRVHRLTLRLLAESSALSPPEGGPPLDEENQHVAHWTDFADDSFFL